jgi:tRNA-dihydrouridine synthase A
MMDRTDRYCRYFLRRVSAQVRLYTEMTTTGALLHGDPERWLDHDASERPLALQLGGSDPEALRRCARMAEDAGFDEVNLNVGCPSDRVQNARMGACLMAEPKLVADCVSAMREEVALPVTVKTRIGVDDRDAFEDVTAFIETVAAAGCRVFMMHARKAWLSGVSPRKNRTVPPLNPAFVYALKSAFPHLTIVMNGGIGSVADTLQHLAHCDGVMIGREAYTNPYLLARIEQALFSPDEPLPDRAAIVRALYPYVSREQERGTPFPRIARHLLGLFHGQTGARLWRRALSETRDRPGTGIEALETALDTVVPGSRLPSEKVSASSCQQLPYLKSGTLQW